MFARSSRARGSAEACTAWRAGKSRPGRGRIDTAPGIGYYRL